MEKNYSGASLEGMPRDWTELWLIVSIEITTKCIVGLQVLCLIGQHALIAGGL